MSEVSYYPVFGKALASGNLRVPTAGASPEGEKWDGAEEISPEHPNYKEWLNIIAHKEEHLAVMEEKENLEREERRARRKG